MTKMINDIIHNSIWYNDGLIDNSTKSKRLKKHTKKGKVDKILTNIAQIRIFKFYLIVIIQNEA